MSREGKFPTLIITGVLAAIIILFNVFAYDRCEICNSALYDNQNYCGDCGEVIPESARTRTSSEVKKCQHCNTEVLYSTQVYCGGCGIEL